MSQGFLAGCITMVLASFAPSADAANWFKLRGTEPGGTSHTLQVWGFLQPTYAKDYSDEIEGAVGGFSSTNGDNQVPGTLPPDRTERSSFYMRRARIGIRGTMIPISNDIDYFILTEWGQNGITRNGGAATLLDASITFNQLSRGQDDDGLANLGARLRMGQFLFSQTSQALSQSTPGRRVHVFMPEATFAHAVGRYVSDNGVGNWPEDEVSANGARDLGVELFDWAEFDNNWFGSNGPLEFTYSFALGNGDALGELNRDDNYRKYAWLSIAKLFDNTRGPRRHDVMLYGWWQKGDILFNNDINDDGRPDNLAVPAGGNVNPGNITGAGPVNPGQCAGATPTAVGFACQSAGNRVYKNGNEEDTEQKYYGFGIEYFDKPFKNAGQIRFEAEWQKQEGLTFDGPHSPSANVNDNAGGFESILYDTDGENVGWHVDVGYDIHQHLGLKKRTTFNVRYDEFNRNENQSFNGVNSREVEFKTWTATAEYFFHKKARATVTYQWRDFDADARDEPFRTNGNAVLEQVDNRIGLQVTFIYKNVLLR
jgi:hypothetical protein